MNDHASHPQHPDPTPHTDLRPEAPRARKRGRLPQKLALACGSVLGVALLVEVAVRVAGLAPPVYAPRRYEPDGRVPFVVHADGRFFYQPNTTFSSVYDPRGDTREHLGTDGRVTYRLNNLGLRGPDVTPAKPDGTLRIVCLGDSFTFGEGVREEQTYPAMLQGMLDHRMVPGPVEVINAGVQGYGTLEELYLFGLVCDPLQPDVVTLGFVLNDATDLQETIRHNDEASRAFEPSLPGRVSALWQMFERQREARRLEQAFIDTTRKSFESSRWNDTRTALRGMNEYSRERGFTFVVVIFPMFTRLDRDYPFEDLHRKVAGACTDVGIAHLDLLDAFRGRSAETYWVHPVDHHPNRLVHGEATRRIIDFLRELGVIGRAP